MSLADRLQPGSAASIHATMPSGKSRPAKRSAIDVGQEVERAVEEREQARHAPEPDHVVPAGDASERRHRERDADEPQRPDAGLVRDIAERIGAEVPGERRPDESSRRAQAGEEDDWLDDQTDDAGAVSQCSIRCSADLSGPLTRQA